MSKGESSTTSSLESTERGRIRIGERTGNPYPALGSNAPSTSQYQRKHAGPAASHSIAPSARYGPKGIRADHSRRAIKAPTTPTTEPIVAPANNANKTPRQPRKAPIAASNFTSPNPITSRGITNSTIRPEILEIKFKSNFCAPACREFKDHFHNPSPNLTPSQSPSTARI